MRVKTIVAAACASALLFAAGCGSDDGGTAGESSGSAVTGKTPPGDPIKVGFVCSCSGGQADGLGRSKDVAQAWANSVNDAGGINGHPVKLFVEDDGGDAAKAQRAVKTLIEQEKVIAIVGTTSSAAEQWAKYAADKGVPVIGGNPFLTPASTDANWFPIGSGVPVEQVGMSKLVKENGKTKLGEVFCAETPICAQLGGLAKAAAAVVGGLEVQPGKAGVAQPNFNALCLSLKQGGVDALAVAQSGPTVTRVHGDCAKQGYKPVALNYAAGSSPLWLKDPNLNGMLMVASQANYQDDSIPQVKQFNAALDKYYPDLRESAQFGLSGSWDTWLGGRLFEAAAKAAKLAPTSTPEDLKTGLYSLKDETLEGATAPLNYVKDQPTFLTCYFVMGIQDGKYTSPQGTDPKCLSQTETAQLGKLLAG
jgi:branched-chain amino acid transport system substrate-binding protein